MKKILTITGPSGSGKSTLEKKLIATGKFSSIVSHTTRAPRSGEVDGVNYHFIADKAEFCRLDDRGFFLESVEFNDSLYGASKAEFEKVFAQDKIAVIVCEPEGRDQIMALGTSLGWTVVSMFVGCPLALQIERLTDRLLGEFSMAVGRGQPEKVKDIIKTHNRRLVHALTAEEAWSREANQDSPNPYQLVLGEFSPVTEEQALKALYWLCRHERSGERHGRVTTLDLAKLFGGILAGINPYGPVDSPDDRARTKSVRNID